MKLTKEQTTQLLQRLNEYRDTRKNCPICSKGQWILNDTIFEVREFNMGGILIGGPNSAIMPMISLSCANCGYTYFMSAIKMGIITPTPNKNTQPEKTTEDSTEETK